MTVHHNPPGVLEGVRGCAASLHDSVAATRRASAEQLLRVAEWADLHDPDVLLARERGARPGDGWRPPRRVRPGGEGTPEVAESAVIELGTLLQTSTGAARNHLADALDLRHRLPATWAAIQELRLDAWKGRKLAGATRYLGEDAAEWVDGQVVAALEGLPYARAWTVVEAKVIAADPVAHEERRRMLRRPGVRLGRVDPATGTRTLYATGSTAAVNRLLATVNRVAEVHAERGDTSPAPERQTRAFLDLGNPAATCLLLADHHASGRGESAPRTPSEPEEEHWTPVDHAVALGRRLATLGADKVLDRLRPRSVLYVHLDEDTLPLLESPAAEVTACRNAVARAEDHGPLSLPHLREWLRGERVTVRPIAYPRHQASVDDYQIPRPLAEAVVLRDPYEAFPYGTLPSRHADLDHTIPHRTPAHRTPAHRTTAHRTTAHRTTPHRPPPDPRRRPPTGLHNLAPLGRTHHVAKTHHGFVMHQPLPGVYCWRTPTGFWHLVDHRGTRALGPTTPPIVAEDQRRSALETHLHRLLLHHAL